jgi:hypothetical protein
LVNANLIQLFTADLENQGAHQLARTVDPNGLRTIRKLITSTSERLGLIKLLQAVLTKPDRIDAGQHNSWIDLLENRTEKFKHGWYCVKQSDQQQLNDGVTREQARENEISFFRTTPWIGLSEPIKRRLGTRFLSPALGTILFDLICQRSAFIKEYLDTFMTFLLRLPELCKEVNKKLRETRESLNELPKELEGDPVTVVLNLTANFQKDVATLVQGRPEDGESGLLQKFRRHKNTFREGIFQQAPQFRPFKRPSDTAEDESLDPNELGSEGTESGDTEKLEPSGRKDPSSFVYIDEVLKMAERYAERYIQGGNILTLYSGVTRELPGNYPYAIKKHYALRFTKNWETPARRLFTRMENVFKAELKKLVQHHFAAFSSGGLHQKIL